MSYRRILLLIAAVLLFGIHSVLAANFAVGTCEPKLVSFSTISDAVSSSSVPAAQPWRFARARTPSRSPFRKH